MDIAKLAKACGQHVLVADRLQLFAGPRRTVNLPAGTRVTVEAVELDGDKPRAVLSYDGIPLAVSADLALRHLAPLPGDEA